MSIAASTTLQWIGAIAAVTAVVAMIIIAALVSRHRRQLAKETGQFRHAHLSVSLFGLPLDLVAARESRWRLLMPFDSWEVGVFPLRFEIRNSGDATCSRPTVVLKAPLPCVLDEDHEVSAMGLGVHVPMERHAHVQGNFAQITYVLPPIHPGTTGSFEDKYVFFTTNVPLPPESIDLPGYSKRFQVVMQFALKLVLTLLLDDERPQQTALLFECVGASSEDQAFHEYLESATHEWKRRFNKLPRWKQLLMFLKRIREYETMTFLNYELDDTLKAKGRELRMMKVPTDESRFAGRVRILKSYWLGRCDVRIV